MRLERAAWIDGGGKLQFAVSLAATAGVVRRVNVQVDAVFMGLKPNPDLRLVVFSLKEFNPELGVGLGVAKGQQ